MDLVDLILLACTLADPSSCREYHLMLQSSGSLEQCAMQAEPYLAQWVEAHPGERVARWRCAWPDEEDRKT